METAIFDLMVIGGGLNGCGIARDAAGRGLSVAVCERGDLGGATSSASTKLVDGGLRYFEHSAFCLVREALKEREVLWGIAPHIIWPLRFVLPHHKGLRPAWLLRLGLFIYDHIGGRKLLPTTVTRRLEDGILKPDFTIGFEYSECWVEDSRLVVLNARDAAEHGAEIMPHTECVTATRADGLWSVSVRGLDGRARPVHARALVNAAGPWVASVLADVVKATTSAKVRMVQSSHIVVPRLYAHDRSYIFQNADRRLFCAIPYERDFTLIGTSGQDYTGDPADVHATAPEIACLCKGASDYFAVAVRPDQVVWTYSGVRLLCDDGANTAQEAMRDTLLTMDAPEGEAALLTVFGGQITTYRLLAEAALERLAPYLPPRTGAKPGWTAHAPLPGGDFDRFGFSALVETLCKGRPWLPPVTAARLARAYGTRATRIIDGAQSLSDLGEWFGADLSAAELRYLAREEWARTAADVVWRRSKLGLRLSPSQIIRVDEALAALAEHHPAT